MANLGLENLTLLASSDALDTHQQLAIIYVVAPIREVLDRHQPRQWLRILPSERLLEHSPIIAILMEHDVATALSFRKYGREERRYCRGK